MLKIMNIEEINEKFGRNIGTHIIVSVSNVIEEENVIGMARLLGDGGMAFYLKDFVILPEFQGKGIGKELLDYVQNYIRNQLKDGWQTKLELMSAKGKEEFYKKFGFEERPSKYLGAGMAKMIQ